MDKDFIKIDDLVRLRLGGVEEAERSGSWLNMRELLDKEMPQDRAGGIIYWRRTFSVVAALSLLATIGIGGYELSNSFKSQYGDGSTVVADVPAVKTVDGTAKSNEVNNVYELPGDNAAADQKKAIADRINDARSHKKETVAVHHSRNSAYQSENATAVGTHANGAKHAITGSTQAVTGTSVAVNGVSTTNSNEHNDQPSNNNKTASIEKRDSKHIHKTTGFGKDVKNAEKPIAAKTSTVKHGQQNGTDVTASTVLATKNHSHHSNVKADIAAVNAPQPDADKNTDKNKNVSIDKMALSSAAAVAAKSAIASSNPSETKVNAVPAVANVNKDIKTSDKNATPSKTDKTVAGKNAPAQPAVSNASENTIAGGNIAKLNPGAPVAKVIKPSMDNEALRNVSVMNMSKGKKVIERMILHEHFIKTSPGEGYFKLDTISVETLTTELGLKAENGSSKNVYTVVKKQGPGASAAKTSGTTSEGTAADSDIVPAATANVQSGASLKAANAAQKSAGSKIVQKLNATFNDIKYKFGSPRFQPGVTAGINSTFFGPNSFKGFQFGFAGNLVFNDQWSILSELKYFHRINGNTSIDDNYSTYKPTANGQFTREQTLNSYSFSALHSIELPVSIRYCMGNFNFFAGGNLVYTFSINTGAETMPSPTPVVVPSVGTDLAPQLKAQDFGSRMGLGYLLGFSYNVGPSTMLDLRSVQTVWDNANTAGSKSISSQLYKSPSLQLSIIYRLGGNKSRE